MTSAGNSNSQPKQLGKPIKGTKHVPRTVRGAIARRKQIAELRLKGWTNQADIARELSIHRSQVCRDFKILDDQFRREAMQDTAAHKALDLRRIEEVIGSLWDGRKNVGVARTILLYLERKAALLGLDAPKQVDITDWRSEARKMGVDPDSLYRDMVTFVAQRTGAIAALPVIELDPGLPASFPEGGTPHHYEQAPDLSLEAPDADNHDYGLS